MASDPPRSSDQLDVGINRITIPNEGGRRARDWARALAQDAERRGHSEAADELSSPRMVRLLQAVMDDARQRTLLVVERAIVEEL